jgi:SAM-dependent methyltransferase
VVDPADRVLRGIFDEDAELYHRIRPGYPAELYDDLAELAAIGPGCRLLEIGPGTGKATVELTRRGCHITAVELGANLAAVARRNLAGYPRAEVVVSAFESWPLPAEPFDVVLCATAFHWLDPAVRVTKSADALRDGGALAVIETHHVDGGTADFFVEVQQCYERFDPDTEPGHRLPPAARIPTQLPEVAASDRFGPLTFRRYEWEVAYSTAGYLDLLSTYSGHRAMAARAEHLTCVAELIDRSFGGRISKRYLTQLCLAYRTGVRDPRRPG